MELSEILDAIATLDRAGAEAVYNTAKARCSELRQAKIAADANVYLVKRTYKNYSGYFCRLYDHRQNFYGKDHSDLRAFPAAEDAQVYADCLQIENMCRDAIFSVEPISKEEWAKLPAAKYREPRRYN